eukprot:CAMPEP_0183323232 /NCGR_PEP_ID=MMETSP0160_2-20130417/73895_1 /TAXON_ID=2839 ORGANISM="Odontella Sinensis, Strain Grunow 1884" /NCGR_SAMPLE_ID=MMETSP0160_2 /ASSEMBLY_ACC=CAM_ASM_000250 /LENGTH=178 /DNA_ID=CAMNT_0025490553 /DNA_START=292 /DNA_END=829 /DNA_ORIENTATION=+
MESKAKKEDRGSASDEERAEIGPSHLCLEENIGHLDDGTSRYRGLEFRASVDRMKGRLISVRAVIEVQERLRGGRVEISYDPAEIISLVYQKLCQKARKTAQQTGRSDAVQAFLACMPSSFESNPVVMMTSCNNMSKGEGQDQSNQESAMLMISWDAAMTMILTLWSIDECGCDLAPV